MPVSKSLMRKTVLGLLAGGALVAGAGAASADVACNRFGECWTVHERYTTYPHNLGVRFHDDAWRAAHQSHRYHWRADRDDDHGYYHRGAWRPFR